MSEVLERARDVAVAAAQTAGKIARERFGGRIAVSEKGEYGDLVTEVDRLAEAEILRLIRSAFPDHRVQSEETGASGRESEWLWLVDPLDGTHNYALGIPLYGVSITLLQDGRPMLGVIYDSHIGNGWSWTSTVGCSNARTPSRTSSPVILTTGTCFSGSFTPASPERASRRRALTLRGASPPQRHFSG